MSTKHISLSVPELLFKEAESFSAEFGYESIQEFIRDAIRRRVIENKVDRYSAIESRMKAGSGVKKFSKKPEAVAYLDGL